MPVALYMDHHVPRAITSGLRLRGVEVMTSYEDGTSELDDAGLLDRARELGPVLFTRDDDLLVEATRRQRRDFVLRPRVCSSTPCVCRQVRRGFGTHR